MVKTWKVSKARLRWLVILGACVVMAQQPLEPHPAHAQRRAHVAKAYALHTYDGPPLQEEFHGVEFTWLSSGYFPLRASPKELTSIVGQVKGVTGGKLSGLAHITHFLEPKVETFGGDYKGFTDHTFTIQDRKPKKRYLIVKKGDPVYTYMHGAEGTALVGAINRHDGTFVLFWGGANKVPNPHDPKQVQWWVRVKGLKGKVGWLLYDPKHMTAQLSSGDMIP